MKKLLSILVLSFLFSGSSFAQKINLQCKFVEVPEAPSLSLVLDTDIEKASWQGGEYDWYHLQNDVFYFVMGIDTIYTYALNRNTGSLIIKIYKFTEEEKDKLYSEMFIKMTKEGKTTDDKSFIAKLIHDTYSEQNEMETTFLNCEKAKAKF